MDNRESNIETMAGKKAAQSACGLNHLAPEYQVTVRLLELVDKTKYDMVQVNGQRQLTAPDFDGTRDRVKGAEVFVGRLPRDCYEDEIMPVLQKIDKLLELRLMLDFSGSTRGYAFALYKDAKTARRACEILNEYEIRPGHRIGVVKSVDNCRLFFGGVPKSMTREDFLKDLNAMLDGIIDVHVYPNAQDRRLNRGFIFVEFKDHRSAAMARRNLIPGKVLLWDHEIAVDWADPEPGDPVDDDIMETVTALFIRNILLETTQQQMKEILQKATKVPILKLKKLNHFAFVHFETREAAEQVMKTLTKANGVAEIYGWEVRWAKPVTTFKNSERQRCIIEAIGKSNQKGIPSMQKDARKPKRNARNDPELFQPAADHFSMTNLLDYFVLKHLAGECVYDVLQVSEPFGYICKITILKNGKVYYEHFGSLMREKIEALESTAQVVYNVLSYHVNTMHNPPALAFPCNAALIEHPQFYPPYSL